MEARRQLHALTLHRPWTWAILHGGKRVENRSWAPPAWLRGRWFALHAGKAWDSEGALEIDWLRPGARPPEEDLPKSCIVGVVELARAMERTRRTAHRWIEAAESLGLIEGDLSKATWRSHRSRIATEPACHEAAPPEAPR